MSRGTASGCRLRSRSPQLSSRLPAEKATFAKRADVRSVPGIGNDRSVAVDRIPAEIIDRIEIVRSPSADFDSQGVGGTINIILKDGATLPPGVILRVGETWDKKTGRFRPNAAFSWSGANADNNVFYSFTLDAQKRFNEKHAIQEVVDENLVAGKVLQQAYHAGFQFFVVDDDAHALAAEHVAGAHQNRESYFFGDFQRLVRGIGSAVPRIRYVQLLQQIRETSTIFGDIHVVE